MGGAFWDETRAAETSGAPVVGSMKAEDATATTCWHSAALGQRISAAADGGRSRSSNAGTPSVSCAAAASARRESAKEASGARYDSVLPLPVSAARTTLRPESIAGAESCCTCAGLTKPAASKLWHILGSRPSDSNVASPVAWKSASIFVDEALQAFSWYVGGRNMRKLGAAKLVFGSKAAGRMRVRWCRDMPRTPSAGSIQQLERYIVLFIN